MTHLSLFSGIGGIDIAAHEAGFETVAFVERDKFCQKVLAKNFPGIPIYDDVTTYKHKGESPDLISAGFPCQPHSLAGKRQASGDDRDLWSEVVRILGEAKPRWFLGENVPGLLSSESGTFFGRVLDDLAQMGYRVGWGVWGACDVGAVHRRNRVFIVAYMGGGFGTGGAELGRLCGACKGAGDDPRTTPYAEHNGSSAAKVSGSVGRCENEGGLLKPKGRTTPNPCDLSDVQAPAPISTIGAGRVTWDDASGCDRCGDVADAGRERRKELFAAAESTRQGFNGGVCNASLGTGNWREWGIPAAIPKRGFRGENDGLPRGVDRHRVNALRALGNAVVPAQVLPILQAIADFEQRVAA